MTVKYRDKEKRIEWVSAFLGCSAGGLASFAVTRYGSAHFVSDLPLGSLVVNGSGSFVIGYIFSMFRDAAGRGYRP